MVNLDDNFQMRIMCHLENCDAFLHDLLKTLTSDPDFLKAGQCQSIRNKLYSHVRDLTIINTV